MGGVPGEMKARNLTHLGFSLTRCLSRLAIGRIATTAKQACDSATARDHGITKDPGLGGKAAKRTSGRPSIRGKCLDSRFKQPADISEYQDQGIPRSVSVPRRFLGSRRRSEGKKRTKACRTIVARRHYSEL